VSDNATAILIALMISASGVLLAWAERPHARTRHSERYKSCDTNGHPAHIHDPGYDDRAGT
jgi:hypothetical protein